MTSHTRQILRARCWKFKDNIDTDLIIPARYLITTDPAELAKHAMEDVDPEFASKVAAGDIIVAGENFGCGSSREHAPIALKGAGVALVIAHSFARIFYRNAFNMGLPILESREAAGAINEGETIEVDLAVGSIRLLGSDRSFQAAPIPPFMRELIEAGGLMSYIAKKRDLR